MPKRFTVTERASIIEAHINEFGEFKPEHFAALAESPNHPAHEWFENDVGKGYQQYRIHRAREFAHIRIRRSAIETVDIGDGKTSVEITPMLVSPVEDRGKGGGYILTNSEEGQLSFRAEAAFMLMTWQRRFASVLSDKQSKAVERLRRELSTPD